LSTSEYRAPQLGTRAPRLGWIGVREIPADTWALIGLTALAALIRLLVINDQSFWMDEALTAYETHSSFGGMLGTVAHVETTPPLYFVLIWVWAHVFGSGEVDFGPCPRSRESRSCRSPSSARASSSRAGRESWRPRSSP